MTGTLRVSVLLEEMRGSPTSGVAVRIEGVNPGSDVKAWTVLVPTRLPGLDVEVPTGPYRLQAWLPSGRILRRAVTVNGGQVAPVEFADIRREVDGGKGRPRRSPSVGLQEGFHPLEFQPAYSSGTDPFANEIAPANIDFLHEEASNLSWSRMSMAEPFSDDLKLHLLAGETSTEIASNLGSTVVSIKANHGARPDLLTWYRHWVRVRSASGASIGALPLPWLTSAVGGTRPQIEVCYGHHEERLEIAVRDSLFDPLLTYMKIGRLTAADVSLEVLSRDGTMLRAVQDKVGNPLAACAAAYVSLATANREQIDMWRGRAPNLMGSFPWMPDGAIVRACTLMEGPVSKESKEEILSSAKEAFTRGLPFFTVGIQHLREVLQLFGAHDQEAGKMLEAVRSISSRCDVSEAFTTLRFPGH